MELGYNANLLPLRFDVLVARQFNINLHYFMLYIFIQNKNIYMIYNKYMSEQEKYINDSK